MDPAFEAFMARIALTPGGRPDAVGRPVENEEAFARIMDWLLEVAREVQLRLTQTANAGAAAKPGSLLLGRVIVVVARARARMRTAKFPKPSGLSAIGGAVLGLVRSWDEKPEIVAALTTLAEMPDAALIKAALDAVAKLLANGIEPIRHISPEFAEKLQEFHGRWPALRARWATILDTPWHPTPWVRVIEALEAKLRVYEIDLAAMPPAAALDMALAWLMPAVQMLNLAMPADSGMQTEMLMWVHACMRRMRKKLALDFPDAGLGKPIQDVLLPSRREVEAVAADCRLGSEVQRYTHEAHERLSWDAFVTIVDDVCLCASLDPPPPLMEVCGAAFRQLWPQLKEPLPVSEREQAFAGVLASVREALDRLPANFRIERLPASGQLPARLEFWCDE